MSSLTHYLNFSFDYRDPTFKFGGYTFAFRVFTPINVYGLDPTRLTINSARDRLSVRCDGLTWAGGQERCAGSFEATLTQQGETVEWATCARHTEPIKSIGTLVGGLPRGQVAPCHRQFADAGGDELTNDPLRTFGGFGVVRVPDFQKLLQYICENGFEHHAAINLSQSAWAVHEAFAKYLGWEVYHHAA